jgi:two-component system CheB/CheR fusion protein
VIVVDPEMRITVWNRGSEELWGLRRDEANGQHLLNLDIGLPLAELRPLVRSALVETDPIGEITIAAVNRRGRSVSVRVVASPMRSRTGETEGAILVLEENRAN